MNTGKYMTLLTSKAQWTGKVLWNFEPSYRQNWNRLKKSRSFCRHDRAEVFFFFFWAEQEQAPFCNGGAIPLRIVLRLLTMFASNFFGLSHCWGLNKDDREVGRNFLIDIFQYLLE